MTYIAGGAIQATDFNVFVGQINEIIADSYSGSTTAPPADYGYGHTGLSTVSVGQVVGAAEWTSLFGTIKNLGTHQGSSLDTSTIPALVNSGDIVAAISTLTQVIGNAQSNRLSIDATQIALITKLVGSYTTPAWTAGIEYTFTADFGTWDNARHYFNLGGSVGMTGSIPDGAPLSANHFWHVMLTDAGVVKMGYTQTTSSGVPVSSIGFYDLTTTYQEIFRQTPSGGYYSGSYMNIRAKLTSPAGTSGVIQFVIGLYDGDPFPASKTGPTVFTINSYQSNGILPYLGTLTVTDVGAGLGFNLIPYSGGGGPTPLALSINPTSLSGNIVGAGTATAGPVVLSVVTGNPPYSFTWTNVTLAPQTVTFSPQIDTPTSSSVNISKALLSGESFNGSIRCTVNDSAFQSAYLDAQWNMTSSIPPPPGGFLVITGPLSVSGTRIGSGTTTTPDFTESISGGVPPYTFGWTQISNTATLTTVSTTATDSTINLSKNLTEGTSENGVVRFSVSDSLSQTAHKDVNWSLAANYSSFQAQVDPEFEPPTANGFTFPAGSPMNVNFISVNILSYTFSLISGSIAPGLSIYNGPIGLTIAGTPTSVGTYSGVMRVTNTVGASPTFIDVSFIMFIV